MTIQLARLMVHVRKENWKNVGYKFEWQGDESLFAVDLALLNELDPDNEFIDYTPDESGNYWLSLGLQFFPEIAIYPDCKVFKREKMTPLVWTTGDFDV